MRVRNIIRNIAVSLLLAVGLHGTAQAAVSQYKFTHLTTADSGLSFDGVSSIMQDSRGFVWVGTCHGLNRYDGMKFDVFFTDKLGLETDYVRCLVEDRDGNIWIGTDNGVCRYNYIRDKFEPILLKADDGESIRGEIRSITTDKNGHIWMIVKGQGLFCYNTKYSHLHHIGYDTLGISGFRRILCSKNSGIWLSRYHSPLYHSASGFDNANDLEPFKDGGWFDSDDVEGIFEGADGQIYVASTVKGISEIDPISGSLRSLFHLPAGVTLLDAFFERERWIWLSTSAGVWRYDLHGTGSRHIEYNPDDRFSLSSSYVTCSFVDNNEGVWLGTKDSGVNWSGIAQTNFEKYYTASGTSLEGCIVSGFCEESPTKVWVSTEQAGFLLWNPVNATVERVKIPGIPRTVCSPCIDGNSLWFGSLSGVYKLDIKTLALKPYGGIMRDSGRKDQKVYLVYKTKKGDIYAGTTLGLSRYNREKDCFEDVKSIDGVFVTSIAEDAEGNMWLSTFASGLYRWNPSDGEMLHFTQDDGSGLPSNKITSVHIDKKGRVWAVGFSHGFSLYDTGTAKFTTYDRSGFPSMPSNVFFCCSEDRSGSLWLSTDKGLIQFDPENSGMRLYTEVEGLLDTKLTNSKLRLTSGKLCAGSDNGFICFSPTKMRSGDYPRIVITGMRAGNQIVDGDENIDLVDKIRLRNNQSSFIFDFSSPDMLSESSFWIQCRLKGYDKVWRDISVSRNASWYNVPAGTYTLEIRSSASSSEWHEAHYPLVIVVKPPFWASTLGITLFLLFILMIYAAVFVVMHKKAERKHRQLEEEYRRTREEEVFREKINTVSQIVGLPKKDQTFLSEFDGIVRENLSNPLLSNEIIADKMAVSPSTLVRRIRRLLETSPNNYVRNLRLAVAAEMLRDPQGNNISEICYTVGFSNVSYFAKCFREMFGKTPTAYAEQIRGSAASVAGPPDKEKD